MFDYIKSILWDLLRNKNISLAMIYHRDGRILWHRGRKINGKSIHSGQGFSKSCLKQSLMKDDPLVEEDILLKSEPDGLPESAVYLNIKSLMILPLSYGFFMYVDSGVKEVFTETDRQLFKLVGAFLEKTILHVRHQQEDSGGITGNSPEATKLRELVLKFSLEEDPVLLQGETGCGKNHVAELIHRYSGRKGKFITINTPGIPENLLESEVFGHKKGAFTDATSNKKGWVEEAEGGTLFFDEIAEVPPTFQARLLQFMESRKYHILGGTEEQTADVRIVAATNRNLVDAIRDKTFREDLYYRLQVLEIHIPPLRERKEDIKDLVMAEMASLRGKQIGNGFWESIADYPWPGNIRQLKSVMKRVGILAEEPVTGETIRQIIHRGLPESTNGETSDPVQHAWEHLHQGTNFWDSVKKPFMERDLSRNHVVEIIRRGLARTDGKYKNLLPLFNLPPADYHRFMAFLGDYKLK